LGNPFETKEVQNFFIERLAISET